jgi:RNA polymerase sigma factor (sigma-70 family)
MMSAPELSRGTGPDPSQPSHSHPGESPTVEPHSDLPRSDRPHSGEPRSAAVIAGDAFAAYRSGDSNRLNELVSVTTPILWHTVRSYRLDSAAAEDVLQSTWLALVRRTEFIEDPRAVLQWLIVTARREAWRVATASRRTEPSAWEGDEFTAPAEDQPETIAVRSAQDRLLWEHIRTLSMRCQQLLRVIAFSDRPDYEAISSALGIPVGSIGPTRGRCLAKLRVSLSTDATWST